MRLCQSIVTMLAGYSITTRKHGPVCNIDHRHIASSRTGTGTPSPFPTDVSIPSSLTHVFILPKLPHRSCRPLPNIPPQHLPPPFRPNHIHHLPQIMAQIPYHERVMLAHRPLRRRRRSVREQFLLCDKWCCDGRGRCSVFGLGEGVDEAESEGEKVGGRGDGKDVGR